MTINSSRRPAPPTVGTPEIRGLLVGALDVLRRQGWTQDEYVGLDWLGRKRCGRCAVGALLDAAGFDPTQGWPSLADTPVTLMRAAGLLRDAIAEDGGLTDDDTIESIAWWNDLPERRYDDVKRVYARAIELTR